MMWKPIVTVLVLSLGLTNGFSKYGRSCKDIGCLPNEACVMAEDPCRTRDEPCGLYPTCQKVSSGASCSTFVCPPGQSCRMDGSSPKCVEGNLGSSNNAPQPNAPLYPNVPSNGHTTTRPPMYRPAGGYPGGGYQGGSVGSGYPGQPSNGGGYPSNNGYPSQGGYPSNNGYPSNGGYPGYPSQNNHGSGGYPAYGGGSNNYPSNYPNNYPYNNPSGGQNQNPYYTNNYNQGQKPKPSSASNPIYDSIKDTLKNIGLFCILLHNLLRSNGF